MTMPSAKLACTASAQRFEEWKRRPVYMAHCFTANLARQLCGVQLKPGEGMASVMGIPERWGLAPFARWRRSAPPRPMSFAAVLRLLRAACAANGSSSRDAHGKSDRRRGVRSNQREASTLWLQVRTTYVLPSFQLIRIIRSVESYSPLMRAAALRNLVCSAPYEVTRGRCYSERRRLVRAYFGV